MTEKKAAQATEYQVLIREDNHTWSEHKIVSARSAPEAIKLAAKEGDHHASGSYKAVPVRSWSNGLVIKTRQATISEFEELSTSQPSLPATNSLSSIGGTTAA